MLKIYVRSEDPYQPMSRGIPFGVVVAQSDGDNGVNVGWSQCSDHDHFDRELGTRIAVGRLQNSPMNSETIMEGYGDPSWTDEMIETVERAIQDVLENPARYQNEDS